MPSAKIVNIISRLNIGGISPFVVPLTQHLNQLGHSATLVAGSVSAREGDMSYLAEQAGISITSIPSLGREISPRHDLATVGQLYRYLRQERPQVVHTHTAKAGFVGRLAAKLAGVPLIFHTYHGHVFSGYFGQRKTQVYIMLERLAGGISTQVVTVSSSLQRDLGEVYRIVPPSKIAVVLPGYELDHLAGVARGQAGNFRAQHNIPAQAPLVAIVGRLVPIKNHDLFLRAMALVHAALPNAIFAIVGDGELREAAQQQAAGLGLANNVRFTGWQSDLPAIYSALDCLVLSSKNEGLPSAIIEALVTGVPVVATAVGGVTDMLADDLGCLTPPNNAEALANGTLEALRNPQVAAAAAANRARAFNLYNMRASAQRLVDYYQQFSA
jgi:glycosyltransferase involved in cell wall biosynthesis